MNPMTMISGIAEGLDLMHGAALITEDGREVPITFEMVDEFLRAFVEREERNLC